MNLTIDPQALETAMQAQVGKAVEAALSGWEVKEAISKCVTRGAAAQAIEQALTEAVSKMNHTAMVSALAQELERAAVRSTMLILHEGLVTAVMRLRNQSDYGEDGRKARERIKAEIFADK